MKKYRKTAIWTAVAAMAGLVFACRPAPPPVATVSTLPEIRQAIEKPNAPLTLVHVWATWCVPCREEFPEILKIYREAHTRGLALQLVSADDPKNLEPVNRFLREQDSPVGTMVPVDLGENFIKLFPTNWSGALPASFFYDADGKLVAEWEGKRSYKEYTETVDRLLKP